jgi:hypothetical protein
MYVLAAAVVVLAALSILNLLLTTAAVRRIARVEGPRPGPDVGGVEVGSAVPPFEVHVSDGTALSETSLAGGHWLVAFYALGCRGCHDQLPDLLAQAPRLRAAGVRVLPVLLDIRTPGEGDEDLAARLARIGPLVTGDAAQTLMRAFAARVTPSYFAVGPDGRITAKGLLLAEVRASIPQRQPA